MDGKKGCVVTFRCDTLLLCRLLELANEKEWTVGHVCRWLISSALSRLADSAPSEEVQ